jgi:hypothetical protein
MTTNREDIIFSKLLEAAENGKSFFDKKTILLDFDKACKHTFNLINDAFFA